MNEKTKNAVVSRYVDFWLLGGASVLIWLVMVLSQGFRSQYSSIETHFTQFAATFGLLTIVCNHPHFMMSYVLAYGRGFKFTLKHWGALILVPSLLIATFGYAYINYETHFQDSFLVNALNRFFEFSGIYFRIGKLYNIGTEILSLSVWIMYLTVGWHYSKQVFGCMMVYASYDRYKLSLLQRRIIKLSVFSIAIYNFISLNVISVSEFKQPAYFLSIPLTGMGVPALWLVLARGAVVASMLAVLFFVFFKNRKSGLPSLNFLISWIAFFVWWAPLTRQIEFYFIAVPFFHSFQYLLFAYGMKKARHDRRFGLKILLLLVVGFLSFEAVPNLLDQHVHLQAVGPTFFLVCFVVFINVHHFFIDSVIWKFDQKELKNQLF